MSESGEVDVYGDLPIFSFDERLTETQRKYEVLLEVSKKLREKVSQQLDIIANHEMTIKKLQLENTTLGTNISTLLKTATVEIERKDLQIAELRRERDSVLFRRSGNRRNHEIPRLPDRYNHQQYSSYGTGAECGSGTDTGPGTATSHCPYDKNTSVYNQQGNDHLGIRKSEPSAFIDAQSTTATAVHVSASDAVSAHASHGVSLSPGTCVTALAHTSAGAELPSGSSSKAVGHGDGYKQNMSMSQTVNAPVLSVSDTIFTRRKKIALGAAHEVRLSASDPKPVRQHQPVNIDTGSRADQHNIIKQTAVKETISVVKSVSKVQTVHEGHLTFNENNKKHRIDKGDMCITKPVSKVSSVYKGQSDYHQPLKSTYSQSRTSSIGKKYREMRERRSQSRVKTIPDKHSSRRQRSPESSRVSSSDPRRSARLSHSRSASSRDTPTDSSECIKRSSNETRDRPSPTLHSKHSRKSIADSFVINSKSMLNGKKESKANANSEVPSREKAPILESKSPVSNESNSAVRRVETSMNICSLATKSQANSAEVHVNVQLVQDISKTISDHGLSSAVTTSNLPTVSDSSAVERVIANPNTSLITTKPEITSTGFRSCVSVLETSPKKSSSLVRESSASEKFLSSEMLLNQSQMKTSSKSVKATFHLSLPPVCAKPSNVFAESHSPFKPSINVGHEKVNILSVRRRRAVLSDSSSNLVGLSSLLGVSVSVNKPTESVRDTEKVKNKEVCGVEGQHKDTDGDNDKKIHKDISEETHVQMDPRLGNLKKKIDLPTYLSRHKQLQISGLPEKKPVEADKNQGSVAESHMPTDIDHMAKPSHEAQQIGKISHLAGLTDEMGMENSKGESLQRDGDRGASSGDGNGKSCNENGEIDLNKCERKSNDQGKISDSQKADEQPSNGSLEMNLTTGLLGVSKDQNVTGKSSLSQLDKPDGCSFKDEGQLGTFENKHSDVVVTKTPIPIYEEAADIFDENYQCYKEELTSGSRYSLNDSLMRELENTLHAMEYSPPQGNEFETLTLYRSTDSDEVKCKRSLTLEMNESLKHEDDLGIPTVKEKNTPQEDVQTHDSEAERFGSAVMNVNTAVDANSLLPANFCKISGFVKREENSKNVPELLDILQSGKRDVSHLQSQEVLHVHVEKHKELTDVKLGSGGDVGKNIEAAKAVSEAKDEAKRLSAVSTRIKSMISEVLKERVVSESADSGTEEEMVIALDVDDELEDGEIAESSGESAMARVMANVQADLNVLKHRKTQPMRPVSSQGDSSTDKEGCVSSSSLHEKRSSKQRNCISPESIQRSSKRRNCISPERKHSSHEKHSLSLDRKSRCHEPTFFTPTKKEKGALHRSRTPRTPVSLSRVRTPCTPTSLSRAYQRRPNRFFSSPRKRVGFRRKDFTPYSCRPRVTTRNREDCLSREEGSPDRNRAARDHHRKRHYDDWEEAEHKENPIGRKRNHEKEREEKKTTKFASPKPVLGSTNELEISANFWQSDKSNSPGCKFGKDKIMNGSAENSREALINKILDPQFGINARNINEATKKREQKLLKALSSVKDQNATLSGDMSTSATSPKGTQTSLSAVNTVKSNIVAEKKVHSHGSLEIEKVQSDVKEVGLPMVMKKVESKMEMLHKEGTLSSVKRQEQPSNTETPVMYRQWYKPCSISMSDCTAPAPVLGTMTRPAQEHSIPVTNSEAAQSVTEKDLSKTPHSLTSTQQTGDINIKKANNNLQICSTANIVLDTSETEESSKRKRSESPLSSQYFKGKIPKIKSNHQTTLSPRAHQTEVNEEVLHKKEDNGHNMTKFSPNEKQTAKSKIQKGIVYNKKTTYSSIETIHEDDASLDKTLESFIMRQKELMSPNKKKQDPEDQMSCTNQGSVAQPSKNSKPSALNRVSRESTVESSHASDSQPDSTDMDSDSSDNKWKPPTQKKRQRKQTQVHDSSRSVDPPLGADGSRHSSGSEKENSTSVGNTSQRVKESRGTVLVVRRRAATARLADN